MKLRLSPSWLIALSAVMSPFILQAETISTWDQLKSAIADSNKSYTLGNGLLIDSATGQIEIQAGSSFTLDGSGFAITAASNLGDKPATFKNAGEFNLSRITFLKNGVGTSVSMPTVKSEANSYGGAIYNTGKLGISGNSVFTGNTAVSTGTTSVKPNTTIIDVTANAYGGAIYNANTADTQVIADTTFSRNTASATTIGTDLDSTSAYYAYGTKPIVTANAYGGAIYNAGSMTLTSTIFDGNSAEARSNYIYSLAQGGAIYNTAASGQTEIKGGAFTNNFASSHVDTYELENSPMDRTPESYRPHAQGGAIYQGGGTLVITDTHFEGNYVTTSSEYAYSRGGAIYNQGNARLVNVTFEGNYAQGTCTTQNYVSSGAIFNGENSRMEIIQATFTGNYATTPGGIVSVGAILNAGGQITISNSTFDGNYALASSNESVRSASSGAIRNTAGSTGSMGTLIITATSFTGNYATVNANSASSSANAGALSNSGGTVTISQGSTFTGNYATASKLAFGGAINNGNQGTMIIENSSIEENYVAASINDSASKAQGGAIYSTGTKISFSSTNFIGNYATAGGDAQGGAIYHEGMSLDMDRVTFNANTASAPVGNAAGGAICYIPPLFGLIVPPPATISNTTFTNNNATGGNSATGGAIQMGKDPDSGSKMLISISNTTFTGNHATGGTYAAGGAINVIAGSVVLNNVTFTGNHASSPTSSPTTANLHGGAIYNRGFLTIINSTFEDNYTMAGNESLGGAIYGTGQPITIIADGQDTIFKGNRQNVTTVDSNGKPVDGQSNAIYVQRGAIDLYTSRNGSIIFYDSLATEDMGCISINFDNNSGYPNNGTVYFKDDVTIENFDVNMKNGAMSMGDNTKIIGDVFVHTDTTFFIRGFTKIEGDYMIMKDGEGTHTVYVDMDDSVINRYSEENPVWNFNNGQSSLANVYGKGLDFILDITNIKNFPEHLRPYIFSHFGQTEELMENVRNSGNVTLIDGDGWTYRIPEIYTEGNRTLDYFDFLSGQYGLFDPFNPDTPNWIAPTGAGAAQVETLWTTTRSLWSFADGTRTQNKARLKHDRNTAIWISGLGNYYTQEDQAHIQGYRYRSWGTSVGGEYTFSPKWTAGAAMGEIWGQHDMNDRMGRIDKNALLALLYINRDIRLNKNDTLSLNLQGGYENSRNKGSVRINRLIDDSLYGKWTDHAWMLDLRATWTRPLNERTWLDTYAGLQYTYAEQGDCNITNDKYAFRLNDSNMYDFRATIGTGIRLAREINRHATLSYARVGIIQDIDRDVPHVDVSGQKRTWTAVGSKPGRTAFNFNVGSSIQIIDYWSLGVDYMIEAANKSLMQTGRVSIMCEF